MLIGYLQRWSKVRREEGERGETERGETWRDRGDMEREERDRGETEERETERGDGGETRDRHRGDTKVRGEIGREAGTTLLKAGTDQEPYT